MKDELSEENMPINCCKNLHQSPKTYLNLPEMLGLCKIGGLDDSIANKLHLVDPRQLVTLSYTLGDEELLVFKPPCMMTSTMA